MITALYHFRPSFWDTCFCDSYEDELPEKTLYSSAAQVWRKLWVVSGFRILSIDLVLMMTAQTLSCLFPPFIKLYIKKLAEVGSNATTKCIRFLCGLFACRWCYQYPLTHGLSVVYKDMYRDMPKNLTKDLTLQYNSCMRMESAN
jgi:hypothetical protein